LLTLTLQPGSGDLQTDSSGNVLGLTPSFIENNLIGGLTVAYLESVSDTSILTDIANGNYASSLNEYFLCAGTFVNGCGATGAYQWNWAPGGADWSTPQPSSSLSFANNLDVPDGGSLGFTFGAFTPNPAPVAPGTYQWGLAIPGTNCCTASALFVEVDDFNNPSWLYDPNNPTYDPINNPSQPGSPEIAQFTIASTPTGGIFERDVVGAPEPSTYAEIVVMASGLFALLLFRRSRRRLA
jgi:hypothetical protein